MLRNAKNEQQRDEKVNCGNLCSRAAFSFPVHGLPASRTECFHIHRLDAFYRRQASAECWYTGSMLDEITFRRHADSALESLKKALILAESDADFEVEEQNGVLNISFDEPPSKFVLTPNAPVRQIWISALSTSFKLDWDDASQTFVLPKTGESLKPLVARLIREHLGGNEVVLS